MGRTYVRSERLNDLHTTCSCTDDADFLSGCLVANWPLYRVRG